MSMKANNAASLSIFGNEKASLAIAVSGPQVLGYILYFCSTDCP